MRADKPRVRLLALAALAGCGAVHGIPIDQTATDIAQTVCSKAWTCCTVAQLMSNDSAGTSAATAAEDCTVDVAPCEHACETKTAGDFRNQLSGVQQSVDKKRATYEQAKVDACLDTIRSTTCSMLNMTNHLTGVPGCDTFTTPLVSTGGACSHDYECISGWCKPPVAPATGDGVCAAAVSGMSCTDVGCGVGFACDSLGTSDQADDVCVQPAEDGAPCTGGAQCKSGNCSASGGSGMTCAASTAAMCFYGSGCAAAGEGRPGPVSVLLLAAFVAVALMRARRQKNRS